MPDTSDDWDWAAWQETHTCIPPGTTPPSISVEVWTASEDGEQIAATVADVVRINDTWHVVVVVDV